MKLPFLDRDQEVARLRRLLEAREGPGTVLALDEFQALAAAAQCAGGVAGGRALER